MDSLGLSQSALQDKSFCMEDLSGSSQIYGLSATAT